MTKKKALILLSIYKKFWPLSPIGRKIQWKGFD